MEVSEMEMKQVYEALEKVENGADLIAAIKGEINTLNNEAKKHRTAGEQSATKLKSILEVVGLEVLQYMRHLNNSLYLGPTRLKNRRKQGEKQ